jgi:hypothetical protein
VFLKYQLFYYMLTAVWLLIYIESFMMFPGQKQIYGRETVGVLLMAISFSFFTCLLTDGGCFLVSVLATLCCAGLYNLGYSMRMGNES